MAILVRMDPSIATSACMKNNDLSNVLVVIPARSGSKSLPNKNIASLNGLPLIMHSYKYAIESGVHTGNIFITTDSHLYRDVALKSGASEDSILIRPSCLAEDNVRDYPVALHAWSAGETLRKKHFEYIVWLRPTSPIRPPGLINDALAILQNNLTYTSVRAMRRCKEHPYRMWVVNENQEASSLLPSHLETGNIPRQNLPENFYYQSGEIEVVRRETLQSGSMSGSNIAPLIIKQHNPDIDTLQDLESISTTNKRKSNSS